MTMQDGRWLNNNKKGWMIDWYVRVSHGGKFYSMQPPPLTDPLCWMQCIQGWTMGDEAHFSLDKHWFLHKMCVFSEKQNSNAGVSYLAHAVLRNTAGSFLTVNHTSCLKLCDAAAETFKAISFLMKVSQPNARRALRFKAAESLKTTLNSWRISGRGLGFTCLFTCALTASIPLHTCSRMVFLFLPSVTVDSCMSPIFFIFSSMSIFCSSLRISVRSSRTVSSLWCWRARAAAHAEWIAVIQFSSSVWPEVWQEQRKLHETSKRLH